MGPVGDVSPAKSAKSLKINTITMNTRKAAEMLVILL